MLNSNIFCYTVNSSPYLDFTSFVFNDYSSFFIKFWSLFYYILELKLKFYFINVFYCIYYLIGLYIFILCILPVIPIINFIMKYDAISYIAEFFAIFVLLLFYPILYTLERFHKRFFVYSIKHSSKFKIYLKYREFFWGEEGWDYDIILNDLLLAYKLNYFFWSISLLFTHLYTIIFYINRFVVEIFFIRKYLYIYFILSIVRPFRLTFFRYFCYYPFLFIKYLRPWFPILPKLWGHIFFWTNMHAWYNESGGINYSHVRLNPLIWGSAMYAWNLLDIFKNTLYLKYYRTILIYINKHNFYNFLFFFNILKFLYFWLLYLLFNLLKRLILYLRLTEFSLLLFKLCIHLLFFSLNILIKLTQHRFYIFYLLKFIYFLFTGISDFVKKFIYYFYIIIYYCIYYLLAPSLYFFARFIVKFFIWFFFTFKRVIIYLVLLYLFFLLIIYSQMPILFSILDLAFDFFIYSVGFINALIPSFLFDLSLININYEIVEKSFFHLTWFHNTISFKQNYNIWLDIYYYIRMLVIYYFPFEFIEYFKSLLNWKNWGFLFFIVNQFFALMWYFLFFIHFDIFSILLKWIYFVFYIFKFIFFYFLKLPLSFFNVFYLWIIVISISNKGSLKFLLYFFDFFDISYLKLILFDLLSNITYFFEVSVYYIFSFDNYFVNYILNKVFLWYDYYYFKTIKHPFDGYIDNLDTLNKNRRYRFVRLRKRFSRAWYRYYKYRLRLFRRKHIIFWTKGRGTVFTFAFTKRRPKSKRIPHFNRYSIMLIKITLPRKWKIFKWLLLRNYRNNLKWKYGYRFMRKHIPWVVPLYNKRFPFIWTDYKPLAVHYSICLEYVPRDWLDEFGYITSHSFERVNIIFQLWFIIILFFFASTYFRSMFFPKFYYYYNTEYCWDLIVRDKSLKRGFLYKSLKNLVFDRSFRISKAERNEKSPDNYGSLCNKYGISDYRLKHFTEKEDFKFYQFFIDTDNMRDLHMHTIFTKIAVNYWPPLAILPLREVDTWVENEDEEIEEEFIFATPIVFDLKGRHRFIEDLNSYLLDVDEFFSFKLPYWTYHKEFGNARYERDRDDTINMGHFADPSSFPSFNTWFFYLPFSILLFFAFKTNWFVWQFYVMEWWSHFYGVLHNFPFLNIAFAFDYGEFNCNQRSMYAAPNGGFYGFFDTRLLHLSGPAAFDYYKLYYNYWHETYVHRSFVKGLLEYRDSYFTFNLSIFKSNYIYFVFNCCLIIIYICILIYFLRYSFSELTQFKNLVVSSEKWLYYFMKFEVLNKKLKLWFWQ